MPPSFIPRPPLTMTLASARSTLPLALARISFTTDLKSPVGAARDSITPAPAFSAAANTLGRVVATWMALAKLVVAKAFPA